MKFKLDENLGAWAAAPLMQLGHDVSDVRRQGLGGSPDLRVIKACGSEGRCLVTLDTDFANPMRFPPADYHGIVVLRIPGRADSSAILESVRTLAGALGGKSEPIPRQEGFLWIVQPGRVRIFEPPDDDDEEGLDDSAE